MDANVVKIEIEILEVEQSNCKDISSLGLEEIIKEALDVQLVRINRLEYRKITEEEIIKHF
jgi:hypothetical protein